MRLFIKITLSLVLLPQLALAAMPGILNINFELKDDLTLVVSWETTEATTGKVTLKLPEGDEIQTDDRLAIEHNVKFANFDASQVLVEVSATNAVGETATLFKDYLADGTSSPISTATPSQTPVAEESRPTSTIPQPVQKMSLFTQTIMDPLFKIAGLPITIEKILWGLAAILTLVGAWLVTYFYMKRRRLWGVVYDSKTRMPVEMAVVRLFDQEHHKLLETRVTSKNGRFSFLGETGAYYLEITKDGYHFPSRIITAKSDYEYANIYRGEVIKLGATDSLIAPDIPIDSGGDETVAVNKWHAFIYPILDRSRLSVLFAALFVALVSEVGNTLKKPDAFSITIFSLLGILIVVEFLAVRRGGK